MFVNGNQPGQMKMVSTAVFAVLFDVKSRLQLKAFKFLGPVAPLLSVARTVSWPFCRTRRAFVITGIRDEKSLSTHRHRAIIIDPLRRANTCIWSNTSSIIFTSLFTDRGAAIRTGPLRRTSTCIWCCAVPSIGTRVRTYRSGTIGVKPPHSTRASIRGGTRAPVVASLYAKCLVAIGARVSRLAGT